jgi:cytochrome c oxidase subunit II
MTAIFPYAPQASTLSSKVDTLMIAVTAMTGAVAVGVVIVIIVFAMRYRHGSKVDRSRASHEERAKISRRIEFTWIAVPLALFMGVFVWAANLYFDEQTVPANAEQIFIVAKQWMWKAQHPDGRREIDQLHVPRGVPVRLIMTSQDVIHSFFVPAFRLKQDVLPGRYTSLWFQATRTGEFHLFCAEYCGTDHSRMGGLVIVMEPQDYSRWLAAGSAQPSLAAQGEALFRTFGCSGCHGPSATVHAPPLDGLYGGPVALADGSTIIADEIYVRDSIFLPNQHVAAGYAPIMPSFAGQVTEEQLLALLAYIESLRDTEKASP